MNTITTTQFTCAFCSSENYTEVINFGEVALAGGFIAKAEISTEKKYPLVVVFCNDCYVVQVKDHVDPEVLFKNDFYFSSAIKTLQDHFSEYAKEVVERFLPEPQNSKTLEFGSNDGVLMRPVKKLGVGTVIGVDPAKNIVETIQEDDLVAFNNFFNVETAKKIIESHGKVDIVMANNVFAHISDINGTTEAVSTVLKDDGVFVFEVHYLGKIIEDLQYDFIYHEHIYYYSLLALKNHLDRHNMTIFDIKRIPIHGGSVRYYAAKNGSKYASEVSSAVKELVAQELSVGYDKPDLYKDFALKVAQKKDQLLEILNSKKSNGKSIVGYGASGRANTMLQYCGIDSGLLDYMIDDAPAKLGMYTPGSHLEIKGSDVLRTDNPDYVVLFAWAFYNEIANKNSEYFAQGQRMILPLPEVKII